MTSDEIKKYIDDLLLKYQSQWEIVERCHALLDRLGVENTRHDELYRRIEILEKRGRK